MRLLCLVCHAKQLQICCARRRALFSSLSAEAWLCTGLIQTARATELSLQTQKQSLKVVGKACKLSLFSVSRKKAPIKCAIRMQKERINLLCKVSWLDKTIRTSSVTFQTGHRNVQNVKAAEEKINSLSQAAGTMKMMLCPTGFLFYLETEPLHLEMN
ncbi:uncharacterized protein LOC144246604 [Lonchura striata]